MKVVPFANVAAEEGGGVVDAAVRTAGGGQVQSPRPTAPLLLLILAQ